MTGIISEMSRDEDIQEIITNLSVESLTLFSTAAIGRDAIEFFRSDIGRYLIGCAQQEYTIASAKLKNTAFWRKRRIQQLQNEIWRAEMFMVWLRDLIIMGKASEVQLEDREES